MTVEDIENASFKARLFCIQTAAEKNFNLDSPDVPDWMKIGVRRYRAGEEITPEVFSTIDLRGGDAPQQSHK